MGAEVAPLLGAPNLTAALDLGLREYAAASGDPLVVAQTAIIDYLVGHDDRALNAVRAAMSATKDARVHAWCEGLLDLDRYWNTDLGLRTPLPSESEAPDPLHLWQLGVGSLHRLFLDNAGTGMTWDEIQALITRGLGAVATWLRTSTSDPQRLHEGLPGALIILFTAAMAEQPEPAATLAAEVHGVVRDAGLTGWLPLCRWHEAYAHLYAANYPAALPMFEQALPHLPEGTSSSYRLSTLAIQYFVAAMNGGDIPFSITEFERDLVEGSWTHARPMTVAASTHVIALGIFVTGDSTLAHELLSTRWDLRELPIPNGDKIRVYDIAATAALKRGDREEAERWLAALDELWDSGNNAITREHLRLRFGDTTAGSQITADQIGTPSQMILTRMLRIGVALQQQDRSTAARDLADIAALSQQIAADSLRGQSVRLFSSAVDTQRLTGRQVEIATLAAQGLTNREIADELFLSKRTVETHMRDALKALGLGSRRELANSRLAVSRNLSISGELTIRQGQIAVLVAAGYSNTEIAATLHISQKTVEKHLTQLMRALNASSRAEVIALVSAQTGPGRKVT